MGGSDLNLTRKCAECREEIDILGENVHSERIEVPGWYDFPMPSEGFQYYCDKCWKNRTLKL